MHMSHAIAIDRRNIMRRQRTLPFAAILMVLGLGAAACRSSGYEDPNDPLASEQYAIGQTKLPIRGTAATAKVL